MDPFDLVGHNRRVPANRVAALISIGYSGDAYSSGPDRRDLVDRVIPGGTNGKRPGRSGFLATPLHRDIAGDVVEFVFVGSQPRIDSFRFGICSGTDG